MSWKVSTELSNGRIQSVRYHHNINQIHFLIFLVLATRLLKNTYINELENKIIENIDLAI